MTRGARPPLVRTHDNGRRLRGRSSTVPQEKASPIWAGPFLLSAMMRSVMNPIDVADLLQEYSAYLSVDIKAGRQGRLDTHIRTMRLLLDQLDGGGTTLAPPRKGPGGRPPSAANKALAEAIGDILRTQGPTAVGDILQELQSRGVSLPGKGDTANLISVMRRMPGVRRHDRGLYSLAD